MENTDAARKADHAAFETLPPEDPHRLLPEDEEAALAKLRSRIRKSHRWHGRWEGCFSGVGKHLHSTITPIVKETVYHGYGERLVIAAYEGPCPFCTGELPCPLGGKR